MMGAVWTTWLTFLVVSFAFLEWFALSHNRTTLSRYVWIVSRAWPPLPFVAGLIVGVLASHFWWGGIVAFEPLP